MERTPRLYAAGRAHCTVAASAGGGIVAARVLPTGWEVSTYYNDSDPYVVQWLRNLIAAGHLPAGEVDERSIVEVQPDDVAAFTHCHFFAGIGGWALAMRLAGWPGERPLWTGSCPCQPFSAAGKQQGTADARHLWPEFFRLIAQCLLFTRGHPKRLKTDVRKLIISPRREHSQKPDDIYGRIEQLVAGPYVELFARQRWPGWHAWGNEVDKFRSAAE